MKSARLLNDERNAASHHRLSGGTKSTYCQNSVIAALPNIRVTFGSSDFIFNIDNYIKFILELLERDQIHPLYKM